MKVSAREISRGEAAAPPVAQANPDAWPAAASPAAITDAATEAMIGKLIARMPIEHKVGQLIQADISAILPTSCSFTATKYVTSGSVDANGVITIVGNETALGGSTTSALNSVSLTPIQTGTTALVGTTDGGKTIAAWKCGPATTNPMPSKYLPGSCKG